MWSIMITPHLEMPITITWDHLIDYNRLWLLITPTLVCVWHFKQEEKTGLSSIYLNMNLINHRTS